MLFLPEEMLGGNFSMEVGLKAPDFVLKSNKGEEWRLSEHSGKVIVLLFYPKNETLVCTRQLCSVRDNWAKYLETKAEIVAVSPGTVQEHLRFGEKHNFPMHLLADEDGAVTRKYTYHYRLLPVSFTRAIIVIDAKGYIRDKQVMLRVFRPTDESVIASIYRAKTDASYELFESILKKYKKS